MAAYGMTIPIAEDDSVRADIVEQMRKEEADLMRKLRAVRDFLSAYGETPANEIKVVPASFTASVNREKVTIEGYTPYGQKVVATAMAKLLTSGEPIRTRQLLEYVNEAGIEVSGKEPVNALGALLYRSADIVSHGKAGWTLGDEAVAREIVSKYAQTKSAPQDDSKSVPGAGVSQKGDYGTLAATDQPIAPHASTS